MTPAWAKPSPAGLSGIGRQQRADERDEDRPGEPDLDIREAERLDDDVEAQSLGQPDQPGHDREDRKVLEPDRPEDAFLEAFVELEDASAGAAAWSGSDGRSCAS